jgi:hypothetical protein
VIVALVHIVDRFGTTYTVKSWPLGESAVVYYVLSLTGNAVVARAVLRLEKGCISDVLVYHQSNRRRGIASALYDLVEADLGRPLVPSRIRSKAGRLFWARRTVSQSRLGRSLIGTYRSRKS